MKLDVRSFFSAVFGVLGLAILLTACGTSDSADTSGSEGTSNSGQNTFTVGIDIPFHPLFNYVAANKDDYFGDKPYKVNFEVLDASTQVPAFGRGELDVMTTPPSFIPRVTNQYGLETAMFFPMARWTTGPQILVPSNSSYDSLEDLQGKAVSIPPLDSRFGAEEAAVMAATGENIRDYFDLKQTDAAAQQLKLGRVEAAFIEAPTTYPLLESGDFKAIYSVSDTFEAKLDDPAVANGGYIARTSFIDNNQQFVNDLKAATLDAWDKYQQNPQKVNKVASQQSGVSTEQLATVGKVLNLKDMPSNERCINEKDVRTWEQIFPLLQQSGFIQEAPDDVRSLFVVGDCSS
jgi:ABC-type nitrate/sulfonate/bicarbonate transport system substrate-binding protein